MLTACAQKPDNITASYVSPLQYQDLDCAQINAEARRLSGRLGELTGQQQRAANDDAAVTAATIVVFWPAAFFIGRGDKAAELARLKGEAEALASAGIAKRCGV
jgi:hypothetical protein